MKNFWKRNASKTLEEFLIECIYENTDFCLSFKEIPNPDFVKRFRTQYEKEFEKLKVLSTLDGSKRGDNDENMSDDESRINGKQSIST